MFPCVWRGGDNGGLWYPSKLYMHVYILPYEELHIATAVGLDDF
jgi:hypothetical protein